MTHTIARAIVAILVGIIAATFPAGAQEAQFAGEATVNIIEVPVRVIDPTTGKAVTGLTAKDFRIFEDGSKMKISNFSEISRMPEGQPDRQPQ